MSDAGKMVEADKAAGAKSDGKKPNQLILLLSVLAVIVIAACVNSQTTQQVALDCSDGTTHGSCSQSRPYFCSNGTLAKKSITCGCPANYVRDGNDCKTTQKCSDGTYYGECSSRKPFYCSDGNLVRKASICGCPGSEPVQGDTCISPYDVGPIGATFQYVLRGTSDSITLTTYSGINNYLAKISRSYSCSPSCPTDKDLALKYLDQNEQKDYMFDIVQAVKSEAADTNDAARVAISMVQRMPYDPRNFAFTGSTTKYPYEVIYTDKGTDGEKSMLLTYILRDLGYGVALFKFNVESHMAVGIKCPAEYSYQNRGYCFVETTKPAIITDSLTYTSGPEVIEISGGKSLDDVSEEYADAREWIRIRGISSSGVLSASDYAKWNSLVAKYGSGLN